MRPLARLSTPLLAHARGFRGPPHACPDSRAELYAHSVRHCLKQASLQGGRIPYFLHAATCELERATAVHTRSSGRGVRVPEVYGLLYAQIHHRAYIEVMKAEQGQADTACVNSLVGVINQCRHQVGAHASMRRPTTCVVRGGVRATPRGGGG